MSNPSRPAQSKASSSVKKIAKDIIRDLKWKEKSPEYLFETSNGLIFTKKDIKGMKVVEALAPSCYTIEDEDEAVIVLRHPPAFRPLLRVRDSETSETQFLTAQDIRKNIDTADVVPQSYWHAVARIPRQKPLSIHLYPDEELAIGPICLSINTWDYYVNTTGVSGIPPRTGVTLTSIGTATMRRVISALLPLARQFVKDNPYTPLPDPQSRRERLREVKEEMLAKLDAKPVRRPRAR